MTRRRDLLRSLLAVSAAGVSGCGPSTSRWWASAAPSAQRSTVFIPGYAAADAVPQNEPPDSRRRRQAGQAHTLLTRIGPDGRVTQAAFPVIGHDVAISPHGQIGFLGRMGYQHDGDFAHHVAFHPETLEMIGAGRPLAAEWRGGGHGVFLPEGALLSTERAPMQAFSGKADDHHGRISIRDPETLGIVDSYSCHGIDPHEIRLSQDGKTLLVANYGSVPNAGRAELSAPRRVVEASVTRLDLETGALVSRYASREAGTELRHLAVARDGNILAIRARLDAAGADWSFRREIGETEVDVSARPGTSYLPAEPFLFAQGTETGRVLAGSLDPAHLRHGLSVEYDPDHDEFLATFPSSHRLIVFEATGGRVVRSIDTRKLGLRYPSGIATLPSESLYVVAGFREGLLLMRRGSHAVERRLARGVSFHGHSHITVA